MVPSLFSSLAIMSSLAFVIELLKLSISQISFSLMPAKSHPTENCMLAFILQDLGMLSIAKDRVTLPSHPVVAKVVAAMVHPGVAATVHPGVVATVHLAVATSRMVRAAVVQAVGIGT